MTPFHVLRLNNLVFHFNLLDYLVTRMFYDNPKEYNPGALTDLKSATVNNETFAILAVKNRFHLFLKHASLEVCSTIDGFINLQENNSHQLVHHVSFRKKPSFT